MKLMVLDGNSIINRAYYGIRPLVTRDGMHTNGIFGFLNILHRLEQEEKPDGICVAFDLRGPTFRHEQYAGYKATRKGMPDELSMQMPMIKEILSAMGIPIYSCQGWEADDVIGTIGRICAAHNWNCLIVTGDRDSLQLVNQYVHVKLVTAKGGQTISTLYTPEKFYEDYGFAPSRLIDLKALMGDSSDNIPGVPGVGQKTASDLLQKFGSLDDIYQNIGDSFIRNSLRKKLVDGEDSARMSFDLATIRCNAPIEFYPQDTLDRSFDRDRLRTLFTRLEFVHLWDRFGLEECEKTKSMKEGQMNLQMCDLPEDTHPLALAFSEDGSSAAVVWSEGGCVLCGADLIDFLKSSRPKICVDWKSLRRRCLQRGCLPNHVIFDVSLAAYVLDPTQNDYSLEKLSAQYLHVVSPSNNILSLAETIWKLWPILDKLLRDQGLWQLYSEIELPLCDVLCDMEIAGITIDQMSLITFRNKLTQRIAVLQRQIYETVGEEFNINSPKKLGEILFNRLQLPVLKKTKTGYSTNAEVLEKLKPLHPVVADILEYRMLTKLLSTYADGLLKVIADDGRIHTTFQNMVTATGRLSSTDPNLQNIPIRRELGYEIRKMFVARDGFVLIDADYSQIELRVLAHIADDKTMQQAFISGEDIHAVTASQVFHVPLDQVTPHMRRSAKAVNFGIVYGISPWSLGQDIGVTTEEAKRYMDDYLDNYHGVRSYMKNIVEHAKETGSVSTIYGRKRCLPELRSSNFNLRAFGERIALNTPIQGTAADIIKIAMLRVDRALKNSGLGGKLLLQVHDELIVECPLSEADKVSQIVKREMENAALLKVPILAETRKGESWYDAK